MEAFCRLLTEIQMERIRQCNNIKINNLKISSLWFRKSRWNTQTIPASQVLACTVLKGLKRNKTTLFRHLQKRYNWERVFARRRRRANAQKRRRKLHLTRGLQNKGRFYWKSQRFCERVERDSVWVCALFLYFSKLNWLLTTVRVYL